MRKLFSTLTSAIFVACVSVPAGAVSAQDLESQRSLSDGGYTSRAEEAYEEVYLAKAKECKSKNPKGAERRTCLKDARAKANEAARATMKTRAPR